MSRLKKVKYNGNIEEAVTAAQEQVPALVAVAPLVERVGTGIGIGIIGGAVSIVSEAASAAAEAGIGMCTGYGEAIESECK